SPMAPADFFRAAFRPRWPSLSRSRTGKPLRTFPGSAGLPCRAPEPENRCALFLGALAFLVALPNRKTAAHFSWERSIGRVAGKIGGAGEPGQHALVGIDDTGHRAPIRPEQSHAGIGHDGAVLALAGEVGH